jgi:thiosulfate/3-mercaptopyruvate sulfurtransferase
VTRSGVAGAAPRRAWPLLVSPGRLAARLHWDDLVVLDATVELTYPERGPCTASSGRAGYLGGHLPGAVFADLLGELSDPEASHPFRLPSPDRFAVVAGALGIGEGRRVVVYDQGATVWAARLRWQLRVFGFDDVAILDGGLPAWRAANQPTETGDVATRAATFICRPRPDLVADADSVQATAVAEYCCLFFTLDEVPLRGEGPDRYAWPGGIPGSRLLPSASLRDPRTGRFLPVEQLRDRLEDAGVLSADRPISYCGGGISATLVAFAAALVGRDDVAVYVGALTEWVTDPSRPLVTGR